MARSVTLDPAEQPLTGDVRMALDPAAVETGVETIGVEETKVKLPQPGDEAEYQTNRLAQMRAHFAAQPKRRIRIRKELGVQTAQVNGFTFVVQPNVWVEVPEQIYELFAEAGII